MKKLTFIITACLILVLYIPLQAQTQCPSSHPHECGGNCYENEGQAADAGCTDGSGGGGSTTCPSSHPYECGGNCYENEGQAANAGCTGGGGTTPTCSDGIMNGNETGIDCGGSCSPCIQGDIINGKFSPIDRNVLLILGQDLGSVNGYKNSGNFPEIGGITQYTNIYDLAGLTSVTNYGAGDQCLQCAINQNPNSTLAIGLWMVEDNDGVGTDHPNGMLDIVNGLYDTQINQLGQFALDNANTPIYLRIGYEFDGSWNHYDPVRYQNAYRYMVDKWRAMGVNNMAYVWQSATWGDDDPNQMPNWYPGDDYVDYVGLSFFFYDENFNGDNLQYALDFARGKNKPIMMAEVSAQYYEFDQNTYHWVGDGPSLQGVYMSSEDMWNQFFVDQLLPFVYNNDDVVRIVAYINADWQSQPQWRYPDAGNGFWGDTRIETNSYITNQWANEIDNGRWLHGGTDLLSKLVGGTSSNAAQLRSASIQNSIDTNLELAVYPNPTAGQFTISGLGDECYTIYNYAGIAVHKGREANVNISDLPSGLYILKTLGNRVIKFKKD